MMRTAGIDNARLGDSSWSLWEPREGEFNLDWLERVLDALKRRRHRRRAGDADVRDPAVARPQAPGADGATRRRQPETVRRPPEHGHHQLHLPVLPRADHP